MLCIKSLPRHPLTAPLLATLVSLCWGANFTAGKLALGHFPAFEASALRFIIVCIALAPFAWRVPRLRWRDALALSLLYITLHFAPMFYAMQMGISLTSTVMISQMGVPFSCLLAAIFFRDYLGPWRSAGLLISFTGLLFMTGNPDVIQHQSAFAVALCGAFAWGCANSYMKIMPKAHVVSLLFWPGLLAIPQLAIASYFIESNQIALLSTAGLTAWLALGYNGLVSSIVGYGIWMWLLARYEVSRVVPYSLLMPVFGLLVGQMFFPEPLGPSHMAGMALTLVGVAIITLRRPKLVGTEKI